MSGQAQIDYDALAEKARGKAVPVPKTAAPAAIDYDALAAQARQPQTPALPPPPPDLTTNSIDPATGTGYGLYRMGSYDFNQGQVTKPEIQVPYNRVADAQAAGYNLHPDEVLRYQNDTKHNGSLSRATGQVKSLLSRMTEPMPDRPLNGTAFQNAAAALTNVGQLPFNVVNRAARAVVGLPQGMAQGAMDFIHGNPEGFDPFAMAENSYKGLQQDTADLGPMAALGNLGGDAATMYAAGKLGGKMSDVGDAAVEGAKNTAQSAVRRLAGSGLGVTRDLVRKTEDTNELITKSNAEKQAAAQDAWEEKQAAAMAEHKKTLAGLQQKFEQDLKDARWKARTGGAEDQKAYWDKRRAAKQAYDQAVKDQVKKFQTEKAAAEKANAEAQRAYNQKIGETAQQNREATAAERAKADQAAHLQVGGSQLIYGLRQLDKALRAKANDLYGAIREKMAGTSVPSDTLADGVKAAQAEWIRGSPAKIAEFNAMLSTGSPGPELVLADQTAQNMGYKDFRTAITNPAMRDTLSRALPSDVWDTAMGQGTKPVSWNDLQGFYEETGARIADGPQPGKGDIYKALQQVHQFVGDQMQKLADAQGVGSQHRAARAFYRDYMDAFHEPAGPSSSGSPVAQALLAKDPLVAVNKFAGDSGDRGIATLRRYSDSLANLAQDIRQRASTEIKVPARETMVGEQPKIKPVPSVTDYPAPPKPPPVEAKMPPPLRAMPRPLPPDLPPEPVVPFKEPRLTPQENISGEDIRRANEKGVREGVHRLASRVFWWGTGLPIFQMLREAVKGQKVSASGLLMVPASGTVSAAVNAALSHPAIMDFFTRPTRQQIATIPLELRGQMPEIVAAVRSRGVLVDPQLAAYAASIQGNRAHQSTQFQGAPQ
jgi:hypothetical protein